jgi:hypothetical protein
MSAEVRGSCLCGKVRFVVHEPFEAFRLCYCSRCRKATGSAHASVIFAQPGNIRWISGQDQIQRFELATARYFARCFCRECGSALPWNSRRDGRILIPAGALDDEPGIRPDQRIFCADQAAWSTDMSSVPCFEQGGGPTSSESARKEPRQ